MTGVGAWIPPGAVVPDRARAAVDTLHAAALAIAQEPDTADLSRALARQLLQAMRADWVAVCVIVYEQPRSWTILRHAIDVPSGEGPSEPLQRLVEWVAQRRQLFHGRERHVLLPGLGVALDELGATELLAVPALHHQGQAIAVLVAADRRAPGGFGALDVRVLETIAQQAVTGFDRAILLGQLSEWTRGMEALLAFSAAVNKQRDPSTLVCEMVEHTARFLHADGGRAGLALPDDASGDLLMRASARWHDGAWREEALVWPRQVGLPGYVLEHEFPYLANEYPTDKLADAHLQGTVRYAMCVPIKDAANAVLGFFELHRGERGVPFTWQDAAFLESLANTTAVAIENARLVGALAAKNDEVRALSADHLNRLEGERQHIARELHDEAGQALVGVKLSLQALALAVPDTLPAIKEPLAQLRQQVNEATTRLRDLARRLRPPTLDQLGLHAALQQLATEAGARAGLEVSLDLAALPSRFASSTETALFRITQEALTNATNHAEATRVEISLGVCEQMLHLRIADDGIGFDPATVTSGLGLLGIRERVSMLGGTADVRSAPGQGTVLVVRVPPR